MSKISLNAQIFLDRLTVSDYRWLETFANESFMSPSKDWTPWLNNTNHLGWLPPARVDQLVVALPQCNLNGRALNWNPIENNWRDRSKLLQRFLKDQFNNGLLNNWRNEFFSFWTTPSALPQHPQAQWLCIERSGFRHLGLMSFAVHINGFYMNGDVWCGHRSENKSTDPGMFDSLTAGGIPAGEEPLTSVKRELYEEAGLILNKQHRLDWAGSVRSQRATPEGWHDETLLVYNLDLPSTFHPVNTDGEVQAFYCWPPEEVVARMQAGQFTIDSGLSLCQGLGLVRSNHAQPP